MKKIYAFVLTAALALTGSVAVAGEKAQALKDNLESHIQVHGFVRNLVSFDTRESVSGTGELFYYLPKDRKLNLAGEDINAQNQLRFLSLTSRLGFDVSGYQIQNTKIGASIEADFYYGLTGTTGTAQMRMRLAYLTLDWAQEKTSESFKMGQQWHPMAVERPDIFPTNGDAPFSPFSRTPTARFDLKTASGLGVTAAAMWQMQFTSAGPKGPSADYIKYSCTPEAYVGLFMEKKGFLGRAGLDVLSIKPRTVDNLGNRVNERITTMIPFLYLQYKDKVGDEPISVKLKTVFAQGGEHVNLNGGYGVTKAPLTGEWEYAATRNSSSWMNVAWGSTYKVVLFAGYARNFGTAKDKELVDPENMFYFSKNSFSNMNQMWRVVPSFTYNLGKFTVGIDYECTSVQYGDWDVTSDAYKHGLATKDMRWITNHRIQSIVAFNF